MSMTKTRRILVTGSNGLLGQKLIELLLKQIDVEVIATARGEDRINADCPFYSMDITSRSEVDRVISEVQPDTVIHTAAMTNVDECELNHTDADKANVEATRYIIAACEKVGAFLVHVSTDFIFNGEEGPLDETASPDPVNYYGLTKLKAEKLVIESKLSWAIARTVLVYGIAKDMSRSNIILWVKKSLEAGKEIKVVDDQLRTPTLAEDLAQGCWLLALKKAEGVYNISGKDMLSPYDMAVATAKVFQLNTSTMERADSTNFKQPAKRPPKTGFIITKATKELGYKPHSFEEGLLMLKDQLARRS